MAADGRVLDQEGGFHVVPSWFTQASDGTTKDTVPEDNAAQLAWALPDEADQPLLAVLDLPLSALVGHPPDPLLLLESAETFQVCWVALSTPSAG